MMNSKSQEIRTLNQIMKKDDILTRFRLLQLWTIDVFTQSCGKSGVDVKQMIEALTTDELDESSQVEAIYANLNIVKKNMIDINIKLNQVLQHVKHQVFIDSLLMKILNEQDDNSNSNNSNSNNSNSSLTTKLEELEKVIKINEQRIQKLSEMSEAKINELLKSINQDKA